MLFSNLLVGLCVAFALVGDESLSPAGELILHCSWVMCACQGVMGQVLMIARAGWPAISFVYLILTGNQVL